MKYQSFSSPSIDASISSARRRSVARRRSRTFDCPLDEEQHQNQNMYITIQSGKMKKDAVLSYFILRSVGCLLSVYSTFCSARFFLVQQIKKLKWHNFSLKISLFFSFSCIKNGLRLIGQQDKARSLFFCFVMRDVLSRVVYRNAIRRSGTCITSSTIFRWKLIRVDML